MLSPGGKKPLLTEDGKKRRDPDDTRRWQVKKKNSHFLAFFTPSFFVPVFNTKIVNSDENMFFFLVFRKS